MKYSRIILWSLLLFSIALNIWMLTRKPETVTKIETRTEYIDTTHHHPVAKDSTIVKVVYKKVPVPTPGDTVHDSISVPIPISQKRYDDSLYTAWVSGYDPSLDSITLHMPHTYTTITKTVTKPASRFAFGPSVGIGYGMIQHKADIYVGVTATYNLWK